MKIRFCENLSGEKRREEAQGKFRTVALSFVGLDALVFLSVPWGPWYLAWGPILAYANWRYLMRPILFGYFICDRDRRLKHGGHLHSEPIGGMTICDRCAEEVREVVKSLENAKRAANELVVAVSGDPRFSGRAGHHPLPPEKKVFRPDPLQPAIPHVDLSRTS